MLKRLLPCLLLIFGLPAQAGTWMLSRDEMSLSAQLAYSTSDHYWDQQRHLRASNCQSDNKSLSGQVEYGWTYYHTVFAETSLHERHCGAQDSSGLGDITLGVRGRWDVFRNGRTWEAALILPSGYDAQRAGRLGYGQVGARVSAGIRLVGPEIGRPDGDALSTEASLKHWFGSTSDQLAFDLRFTHKLSVAETVHAAASLDWSLRNGQPETFSPASQTMVGDYDKLSISLGWSRKLSRYNSISLDASHALWGRNASQDNALHLNYHHTWPR